MPFAVGAAPVAAAVPMAAADLPQARAIPVEVQATAIPAVAAPVQVQVQIPAGMAAGSTFEAQVPGPAGNTRIQVTVPEGSSPGDNITVQYQAPVMPVAQATRIDGMAGGGFSNTPVFIVDANGNNIGGGLPFQQTAPATEQEIRLLPVALRARSIKWSSAIDVMLLLIYAYYFRFPYLLALLPGPPCGYFAGAHYSIPLAYCNAVFIALLCASLGYLMMHKIQAVAIFVVVIVICELCLLHQVNVFIKLVRVLSAADIAFLKGMSSERIVQLRATMVGAGRWST